MLSGLKCSQAPLGLGRRRRTGKSKGTASYAFGGRFVRYAYLLAATCRYRTSNVEAAGIVGYVGRGHAAG